MNDDDWKWLVNNKFLTEEFQKKSDQNAKNCRNGDMPHRTGSKPHRQVIYEKGGNLNVAEIFYETRQKAGKFSMKKEKDKYDELAEILKENPSLSQLKAVEKCFGQQSKGSVVCFGGGMKRKYFPDDQSTYVKELEVKILEGEEEKRNLKKRMDTIESRLNEIVNSSTPTFVAPSAADSLAEP